MASSVGLSVSLVTFVPNTLIQSAQVNANFSNLNNATQYNGTMTTINSDGGKILSDGNGNILFAEKLGVTSPADVMDVFSGTGGTTYIKGQNGIAFQVPNGTTICHVHSNGFILDTGHLSFPNNSFLARSSSFTGGATGTYNHGNNGAPNVVNPMTAVSGSQAMSYDNVTSTQVHVQSASGLGWKAWAVGFL